jgi:hypothetical protein
MKLIPVEDAVGTVLCHDMTQIIPGVIKDARFRKGHIVTPEDVPILRSMGKENIYVWEQEPGMLHEDEAAGRLRDLCLSEHMSASKPKEGKIEIRAEEDGCFLVDEQRLFAVNSIDQLMIATRHGGRAVKKGDKLAGMRVIPLVIDEKKLEEAERAAGESPLLRLRPFEMRSAAVITTGSEVYQGLVQDQFTPVVERKLAEFGISMTEHVLCSDDKEMIANAIGDMRKKGAEIILCTGGMSVDPDDCTPGAIRDSGADLVTYGAPTLPGAMICLGYFSDGVPIVGLPGCVMYARTTIFDLLLPKLAARIPITRDSIIACGHGGLCLGCETCTYPNCGFGV